MRKTAMYETVKRQSSQSVQTAATSTVFSAGFWMIFVVFCAFVLLTAQSAAAQATQKQDFWKQAGADDNLRQAFERALYALEDSGHGLWHGSNDAQKLSIEFDSQGARLKHPLGSVGFHLAGYGYGDALQSPVAPTLHADGTRLEYRRGDLTEWYVNGRQGLEQGFTLRQRPQAGREGAPLGIALGVTGDLALSQQDGAILLKSGKSVVLRYAGLTAVDARGRKLPARLETRGKDGSQEILITVDDRAAQYPLTVDPTWSQEQELTASDGAASDYFGYSVSVSGTTVVIGSPGHTVSGQAGEGNAYIFKTVSPAVAPVFTPKPGTFAKPQSVTLSDTTSGAVIYYTTDGKTTPTSASTKYTGAISVARTETIKAVAIASGYSTSAVTSGLYTILPPVASLTLAASNTAPYYSQSITLTATVSINYGSAANTGNYVILDGATTVCSGVGKLASGYACSVSTLSVGKHTLTATYTGTVNGLKATAAAITVTVALPLAAMPTISPASGTYGSGQLVTITDSLKGATIHYTTNGAAPTATSPTYTGAFLVSASAKVQAIAVATGYSNSTAAAATYTLVDSPAVLSLPATVITTSGAKLGALVYDQGAAGSVWFVYGTSATTLSKATSKAALTAASTAQQVSVSLTGLITKTVYYFQPVVSTIGGATYGTVLSFKTN